MNRFKQKRTVHGFSPQRVLWLMLCLLFVGTGAAWADDVVRNTTQNTTYATLQDAFDDANAGDVIELLADVDATSEAPSGRSYRYNLAINAAITLKGNDHMLTVKRRGIYVNEEYEDDAIKVTIENLTIKNVATQEYGWGGQIINTRGGLSTLTLRNVTFDSKGTAYNQGVRPLVIGGNQKEKAMVVVENCKFIAPTAANQQNSIAITVYNPVEMTIKGTTIDAYYGINLNGADDSYGSRGSTLTIDGSTITTTAGAAVLFNADELASGTDGSTVKLTGETKITTPTADWYTLVSTKNITFECDHFATNKINATKYETKPTIQIATVADLQALATACNTASEAAKTAGNTYELTADLDMSGVAWTPAGGLDAYPGTAFKGTFDGKGHTISNLTCTDTHAKYATAALFGATSGYAIIKNLTLKDVNITSTHYAAGFVAYEGSESNYTTIENCHVIGGSIVSKPELLANGEYDNGDKVGGIVGYTVHTDIKNCSVEGVTLQAYRDLGGLAGFMQNGHGTVLEGNTVKDVTLTQSDENGYKTNADGSLQDMSSTVGEVVGGRSGADVLAQANDSEKNTTDNVIITEPSGFLAKIGDVKFPSLSAAVAAIKNMAGTDFVIDMFGDGTLDIAAWSGTKNSYSIGKEDTESITINGNNHTLTFNQHDSDWDNVATMNDAKTKLILNDMTINNSGYNNGPWNRYDINFNCAVELNNVVAEKAVAFKNDAKLNNFTVNDQNDVYAIWIQTNGQKVEMNNVTVNAPNGRGIAVKDQYVDAAPETITSLTLDNVTFDTKKKAAILVTAKYGVEITTTNLDITKCDADSENAIWVDEDLANQYGDVTLTGDATMIPEGGVDAYTVVRTTGEKVEGYYTDLAKAVAEAEDGQTIKLTEDLTLTSATTLLLSGKTIDKNGHHIVLNAGVSVTTDAQAADLFEVADATYMITETQSGDNYIYTAVTKESEGVYELTDGVASTYDLSIDHNATKVTYTRSFSETNVGKYLPWFLPFDYTITEDDLDNFSFYKINMIANAPEAGVSEESEMVWIFVTEMNAGDVLKANKPYVFKPKFTTDNYEFVAENVTLKKKDNSALLETATTEATYSFYGTYEATNLAVSTDHRDFYMSINGELSYPVSAPITIGPYRWYLRMEAKGDIDYARGIGFMVDDNNETTGLRNVVVSEEGDTYYTLNGVRVQTPSKGVYIKKTADGKTMKVMFK